MTFITFNINKLVFKLLSNEIVLLLYSTNVKIKAFTKQIPVDLIGE